MQRHHVMREVIKFRPKDIRNADTPRVGQLTSTTLPAFLNRYRRITHKICRLTSSIERIVVALALALYMALLIYVIPRHEPWADEAQAWELAKSLSLKSLFGTYIHYEGSPGLWHFLLWLLARMHVTYGGMHWFTGAIAIASAALLMLASPFPLPIRVLLPFTYFFAFQYAVIARSYVLFPLILLALACVWPTRRRHPFALALLLGLLANVSLHGLAVAVGLGVVLTIERYSIRKLEQEGLRMWLLCAGLFSAMVGFAVWCIAPARDAGWVVIAKQMPSVVSMSGMANHLWMRHVSLYLEIVISTMFRFVHVLDYGLAGRFYAGVVVWLLLLLRLKRQGMLRYTLPVLSVAIPSMYTTFNFYHAGLLWVLFVFMWWVTWPNDELMLGNNQWMETALLISVLLCIAPQLLWASNAIRYDVSMPYSPSRDGAVILESYLKRGYKVDVAVPSNVKFGGQGEFYITDIEPYFAKEPIHNKVHRFWFWGSDDDMRAKYLVDAENHSAVIVVEEIAYDPRYLIEEKYLELLGYRRAEAVCGTVFYPVRDNGSACHVFYQPRNQQGRTP